MVTFKDVVDWFKKSPGKYVGIAIIVILAILLACIRYKGPSPLENILGPGTPIPDGMQKPPR